jgi:membrane-associated phospholipid phosphatase
MLGSKFPDVLTPLLTAHWRLKVTLTAALNLLFWGGYGFLCNHALFPFCQVPLTALDRSTPFQPVPWAWIYLSQYVFVAVLPWLLTTREAILRYAAGVLIMSLASFACFLFFPTPGPRPLEVGDDFAMRTIANYDGTLNACPSLHAVFLVYMALLAWRMFGRVAPILSIGTSFVWGAAILYSTLATKQHYVIDLAVGAVLGALADWLAWRGASPAIAELTIPRNSGSTSQAGSK